jgi:tRNA threonylcarbamoyladenosine biosynthesis protein TsaB
MMQPTEGAVSRPAKPILAIETTGRILSVALSLADDRVVERRSEGELSHLTDLVPTVKAMLGEEGVPLASLGAIAVSAGPGSFTGIRIGISTARALAQVTGLPVVKVPTLETFVYGYDPGEIICPMLDARRDQLYCGAYRLSDGASRIETLVPGAARGADEFAAKLDEALCAADRDALMERPSDVAAAPAPAADPDARRERPGDVAAGSSAATPAAPATIRRVRDEDEPQSAVKVLKWALAFGEPANYTELEPIYMRKAEAQRRLEERLAAQKID